MTTSANLGKRKSLVAGRRVIRIMTVALSGLTVTGCPEKDSATWTSPGATNSELIFLLGEKRDVQSTVGVSHITVSTCVARDARIAARIMWDVEAERSGRLVSLNRVKYGELPSGFVARIAPLPLKPGCYVAKIAHSVKFEVAPDGAVREVWSP